MRLEMPDTTKFTGKRVLLVEDGTSCTSRIENDLNTLGFGDVFYTSNLCDAEEIAATQNPDIALMNVTLKDGLKLVSLGRAFAKRGIPVLFMSGLNIEETALVTRGFEHVEKPLSLPRLKAALQRTFVRANVNRSVNGETHALAKKNGGSQGPAR